MTDHPYTHDRTEIDEATGVETTGHEWDGIQELNNPLPRWWLYVFYACIAIAVVYCILMPSYPGLPGVRGHSDRANVAAEMVEAAHQRSLLATRLLEAPSLDAIEQDPTLLEFAVAAGQSAFGDNCATCHGSGGQGYPGYPNLSDDVWLWGGTLDDIRTTIIFGIRAHSDQGRMSQMPAFGDQGLLTNDQINDLTTYVMNFTEPQSDQASIERARPLFNTQCAACHQTSGAGDRTVGAPNLTDAEWLYGSDRASIRQQIVHGRNGVMPNWGERLDEGTITALAVYVHALGGGEATAAPDSRAHNADDRPE
ncbi:cytochrome-c oxidase, cbb3-type subunit III [Parvularcula sp. LCG005]|uniref:cytochrome-c oxidase, cbb3-type subunit III n=1 Tax=Parvularcula sp. LCG005 TaxID=3078805 RepID=UPI00294285DE|nr:cytochrome-c oxidase, cbb3-type subunit III [Parvularcula sp. LCG005]WOI54171.1 cytochrome-c oxidase, cbb3-type subunit III [Parvularcula sp. LCG005]